MHCTAWLRKTRGEIMTDVGNSVGVEVGAALGGAGNRFGEYTTNRIYVPRFGQNKLPIYVHISD